MNTKTVIRAAGEAFGIANPLERCREQKYVWARAFAIYTMRQSGLTFERVGEAVRRDHATCIYLNAKMEDAFRMPKAFSDILDKYETFRQILQNYDIHERTNGSARSLRKILPSGGRSKVVLISGSRCIAPYPSNLHTSHRKPIAAKRNLRTLPAYRHA